MRSKATLDTFEGRARALVDAARRVDTMRRRAQKAVAGYQEAEEAYHKLLEEIARANGAAPKVR